jgi:hypothetical protein
MLRRSGLRRVAATATSVLVAVGILAGCGGSSSSSSSSTTAKVSPADLSRAAAVSSTASGYRAVMSMNESVPGLGHLTMTGDGSFGKQQGQMTVTINMPGALAIALGGKLQLSMVVHGGILYMKLPQSLTSKLPGAKPWIEIDLRKGASGSGSLSSLMNSSQQLSDPAQYFQWLDAVAGSGLQNLGSVTVNGVPTTHYHANVSLAQLMHASGAANQPMVAQAQAQLSKEVAGGKIPIDVYVDSSNLVRRIVINETMKAGGKNVMSSIMVDFPQYGTQPAPTVPPASQVSNLKSLAGSFP